jgi:hypothetical protein
MKARIVKEFHDKSDFRKVYRVNDLVDFSESRYNELKELGLVEAIVVTPIIEEGGSSETQMPEQKQERRKRTRKND